MIPQATIAEVWALMRELDVRHVPIVRGGALVGILIEQKVAALTVVHLDTRDVVGIVSYIDVLPALQDLLEEGE